MIKERIVFTKEMIDKFNDFMYKLTETTHVVNRLYNDEESYFIEVEVDDEYNSMDLMTGKPTTTGFLYGYTDKHKLETNNRAFIINMLENQIKLIKEYNDGMSIEKYILFKEFLDWLEEKQIRHTLSFKEEILNDDRLCSQFELMFYSSYNPKYKSIVNHIDKDRLSKLHIYSYTRE